MTEGIERHGWKWAAVPIGVIHSKTLSSNAKVVYSSILYRAGKKETSWPSEEKMAEDIGVSVSTVKRALKELVDENWIRRVRRIGRSTVTHIFERQEDCLEFDREAIGDPTSDHRWSDVGPSMVPQNESQLTIETEQERCELTPEQHKEAMLYLNSLAPGEISLLAEKHPVVSDLELSEWPYWLYEIIPRNESLAEKSRNTPIEDLTYVAHFSAETQYIINAFRKAWGFCPPVKNSKWEKDAREFVTQCGESNPVDVLSQIHKEWKDESDRLGRDVFRVHDIGSILSSVPKTAGRIKTEDQQPQLFDGDGEPVFYG